MSSRRTDLELGHKPYDPDALDTSMPSHWVFKRDNPTPKDAYSFWQYLWHIPHQFFCVISLGHGSLRDVWSGSYPGCPIEVWKEGRNELRERLEHINLVVRPHPSADKRVRSSPPHLAQAGLLLSAMTGFCTTDPPGNGRILPYTKTGPYIVLLVSISLSLGGLIVGSAAAFVIHKSKDEWFREVRRSSILSYQLGIPCPILHLLSP